MTLIFCSVTLTYIFNVTMSSIQPMTLLLKQNIIATLGKLISTSHLWQTGLNVKVACVSRGRYVSFSFQTGQA